LQKFSVLKVYQELCRLACRHYSTWYLKHTCKKLEVNAPQQKCSKYQKRGTAFKFL